MSGSDITKEQAFEAAKHGNREVVDAYLLAGHDVNELSDDGTTLLYHFAMNGHLSLVEYLVNEKSADLNKVYDSLRRYPGNEHKKGGCYEPMSLLGMTIHLGMNEVAKSLCQLGADVNEVANDLTAFYVASYLDNFEMMEYLFNRHDVDLNWRPDTEESPLYLFAQRNNLHRVKWMVERGAKTIDEDGNTLFMEATKVGNADMMEYAYEKLPGVNLETGVVDERSEAEAIEMTPMEAAFCSGQLPAVNWLLEKRVRLDVDVLMRSFGSFSVDVADLLMCHLNDEQKDPKNLIASQVNIIIYRDNLPLLKYLFDRFPSLLHSREATRDMPCFAVVSLSVNVLGYLLKIFGFDKKTNPFREWGVLKALLLAKHDGVFTDRYEATIQLLFDYGMQLMPPTFLHPSYFFDMFTCDYDINKSFLEVYKFDRLARVSGHVFSDALMERFQPMMDAHPKALLGEHKGYIKLGKNRSVHPLSSPAIAHSRIETVQLFKEAWNKHNGKRKSSSAGAGAHSQVEAVIHTISLRRICRTRNDGKGGETELVEPFGREVVGFMGRM